MAKGATEFIDLTTADVYLEEKWSQTLTVAREKKLVFAQNVDRQFEGELKKGQILRIGNITQPTATAKSANTALTYETVTETESTITINTYYYTAVALEDVIKPMVSVALLEKYVPGLAYGLGLQEDSDLAALIDDGTISQTVGTLGTELTYDNLVRADQYLNDANVPDDDRVIIISPAQKAGFLKMDEFINRDYQDIRNGILGSWMNYPIFVSSNTNGSNAAGHDCVMMHKECIAHVSQIKPQVKSFWDIDYFCAKMAALTTYGSTIRRADHGVWLKAA
jgi:hypothetical protein|tara:strand:+ start:2798 stop:3637 length:840 start_codon:yes stop_codon:yes gene_type:complete